MTGTLWLAGVAGAKGSIRIASGFTGHVCGLSLWRCAQDRGIFVAADPMLSCVIISQLVCMSCTSSARPQPSICTARGPQRRLSLPCSGGAPAQHSRRHALRHGAMKPQRGGHCGGVIFGWAKGAGFCVWG
jgi:hypothetical protein